MSIRLLARELYRAELNVDQLEKRVGAAGGSENADLDSEIKIARQERDMLRKMLAGEKESGNYRKRFDGFGS